jgi:flavin reductase (DIM6/NTAB) family NADH-FMN oxidoreductase RutF
MRKNFGAKPWTYPQPVFILATYNEDGTPDAMNAAWGGISEDKELSMCISEGHKTTANILARKAFTVSMATAEQMVACDYVGIESGNQVADKVAKAGWHTTKSGFVERFPELSLFFKAYSLLDSEMICIFPYFCPYAESAREIREIFS